MRRLFIVFAILALMAATASARIINIPGDYSTIQVGINASVDGDTVLVQPGTYYENVHFAGRNITLGSLYLTTSDTTYITHTIIDAGQNGSVVSFGLEECAIITGFTLTHGAAVMGGGIVCLGSSARIVKNIITSNSADSLGGGGIACQGYSISGPVISENIISSNEVNSHMFGGGGIICVDNATPFVSGNIISENESSYGGGIYCGIASNPTIQDNSITDNIARSIGGGIYIDGTSDPSVVANDITGNQGDFAGGGIGAMNRGYVSDNLIKFNLSFHFGGGVYSLGNLQLIENLIVSNTGLEYGGGVYGGDNIQITGNVIKGNRSSIEGGGVHCFYSPATLNQNVIVGNFSRDGGGLWSNSVQTTIVNTIFWGNVATNGPQLYGSLSISYCDVQGGYSGQGNIDADPFFVDTYNLNYNVCLGSPCIDSGDPSMGDPDGSRADIGLYFPQHPDCGSENIWYVSMAGNDTTGDGSQNSPFRTIQRGLSASYNGDTVLVGNGTYYENVVFGGKNVVLASHLIFSRDTMDVINTIIDGGATAHTVYFDDYEDSTAVLMGFTIRNGFDDCGGGIRCFRASPTLRNNIIWGNHAEYGAGIDCMESNAIIEYNIIRENIAEEWGGAITCHSSNTRIRGNTVINNSGGILWAGGINIAYGSSTIENNIIAFNTARYGAGIYCGPNSNTMIRNNVVSGNMASSAGGGIRVDSYLSPRALVENTIIWGNQAADSAQLSGAPDVRYCDIEGGWPGMQNISVDPLFRDFAAGDFHLASTACGDSADSPCIDTGHYDTFDDSLGCDRGLGTSLADMGAFGGGGAREHGGRIIYVPADYQTIQDAIHNSYGGDTVLVEPGVYYENLNFEGQRITLASRYLLSGDSAHIANTILDGSGMGSVIVFDHTESAASVLYGFTIRNGESEKGGGIRCRLASPSISHNIVTQNHATSGGGYYCVSGSPCLKHNLFLDNRANFGGGVYCDSTEQLIDSCVFMGNQAVAGGGAIRVQSFGPTIRGALIVDNHASEGGGFFALNSQPTILNNTLYSNFATQRGGGLYCYYNAYPQVRNTIFWNNEAPTGGEIYNASGHPSVTYCDIEGGWEGEGNIDSDPFFCQPESLDFELAEDSPCLGSGFNGDIIGAFGIGCEATAIEGELVQLPTKTQLFSSYPNPFNSATTIPYSLSKSIAVTIEVFDILGRRIDVLVDRQQETGYHAVSWNGWDKSSGIYFYKIQAGDFTETKKMLLLK